MTLLATWCLRERRAGVETIRQEFPWALPLVFVVVESLDVDNDGLICFDQEITGLSVPIEGVKRGRGGRWIDSKRLLDDVV